jgi:hypothetical protein
MTSESTLDISESINSQSNQPINLNHEIKIDTNNFDQSTESITLDIPENLSESSNYWIYILMTFCLIGMGLYIFKKMDKEKEKIKQ